MNFISALASKISENKRIFKLLLIDGEDKRAQEAAFKLKKDFKNIEITLLTEEDQPENGLNFLNIFSNKQQYSDLVNKYIEIRKGKETIEQAEKVLKTKPYYGAMLLKLNIFDAVVGGLNYPTSDILRAAFKIIGPKPGIKTISSAMILHNKSDEFIFADISVVPNPGEEELAEIGLNATSLAKQLNIKDHCAFLSFSTFGSAITPESTKVQNATNIFNSKYSETKAIGEIQFDAAFDYEIQKYKYKGEISFKAPASIFIFPNLDAGNIGYKLVQRLGNYGAIGPIIAGINQPINDLSRGSTTEDIYYTCLISLLQSI